jgi:lysophospholipase L1-like esterase
MTSLGRRTRMLGTALAAALTLTLSTLATTPAASAHAHQQGHQHGHQHGHQQARHDYLALGDSVAFGYRPPEVTPPADYLDAGNFTGYPDDVAGRLHLRLANASCPGETTASMIDATAQSNGCENSVGAPYGYRTAYPLHVSYTGAQLDYAVHYLRSHPRTRLVTLDIGANDLFVCQSTTADQCTGSDFTATVSTVQKNLDTILGTLRHAAHYHHRLVVVSYYSLDYADPVGTGSIAALDAGLAQAAHAHHAKVADGFDAFRRAAAGSGGDSCAAGLIIALPSGGCNVHPTAKGHRVLARAVERVAGR